ncbi:mucin-20 isoform X1 [Dipodomys spectabilis]|uniref:mucin-20 isoform X1 n=1 Tax=Dipodomys spectabilis TaxID=105255 RepID=UPI001C534796|nr:mucin-20 isoform X1 [Dipodomys spectabilis]
MGSVWGLALLLLFFCWEAGGSQSSAGPSTRGSIPLVTTNNTEVTAMTQGFQTSSERAFRTTDLHELFMSYVSLQTQTLSSPTISKTLITTNNRSEAKSMETRTISPSAGVKETPTISPLQQNRTLSKIMAPTTMAVMTTSKETLDPRGSPTGRGTHPGTGTNRDPTQAIFANPCSSDSSEEANWIKGDISTRADTPTEAQSLSSESSSSSDSSVSVLSPSQDLAPGILTQAKALAAYRITHIEFSNCSITKIETAAIISETSDTGPRPTEGEMALSTTQSPALPLSPEAKPYIPNTTAFVQALSSASTSAAAVLDAATVSNPRGTWVTVTRKPLEETSVLSFETSSHTEVPGALPVSKAAGSTGAKGPSFAVSSASVYSPSDQATTKDSSPSETWSTASAANKAFPTSRNSPSSVHPATASTSSLPSVHPATTASSQTPSLTSEGAFHESLVPSWDPFHAQTPSTATTPKTIITAGSVSEVDSRESHTTSPTPGTTETPTNSPAVETLGTLATSPEAETQVSSSTSETTETPHISPAAETLGTLTISPDTETLRTQSTLSSTTEIMETPTISTVTEPTETLSTYPVVETKEIGTVSSVLGLEGTLTIAPAAETMETPTSFSAATQTTETPTSFPVAMVETHFTNTISPTITPPHPSGPGTCSFVADTTAIQNSSPSESSTTDSITNGSFPTHRSLLPSIHPTTASGSPLPSDHLITATSSQETLTTFVKTTASPMTPTRPLTSTPATFWSRQTIGVTAGGDGGFLLVRLGVASPEDLTEPGVAEKLMEQLHCELLAHKLLVQFSLLRVKRS